MYYEQKESGLLVRHKNERMYIEAWGRDSLRVRTTQYMDFTGRDWALSETVDKNVRMWISISTDSRRRSEMADCQSESMMRVC